MKSKRYIFTCDRCGEQFEKYNHAKIVTRTRRGLFDTLARKVGIYFNGGNFGYLNTEDALDLCPGCVESFRIWWQHGK